jgi:hypothetical protein
MVLTHLNKSIKVARLLLVDVPDVGVFRYQTVCVDDYIFCGEAYEFLPFTYSGTTRRLEQDNNAATLSLPNIAFSNGQANPLLDFIKRNNGLRRTIVEITTLFPQDPTYPTTTDRLMVASSSIGENIQLKLQNPTSAVSANVPQLHFTRVDFPELPIVNSGSF